MKINKNKINYMTVIIKYYKKMIIMKLAVILTKIYKINKLPIKYQ